MAVDYFAHAVYGVILDDDDHDNLETVAVEMGDCDLNDSEVRDVITACDKAGLIHQLRVKYNAPTAAQLHWTAAEDDHPGRCNTAAEIWILGIGVMAFPSPPVKFPGAEWHMWVTAG